MFSDPVKNLRQLGLGEEMIVVDLGAGTGFYSVAAARMALKGKVYAVEIEPDYVLAIQKKAKENSLTNLEVFWGNFEKLGGTKIGDNVADRVIASNILSQIVDPDKFIAEAGRILKAKGRLLLVDWLFPLADKKRGVVSKEKIRENLEKKGFVFIRDIDAGTYHYGMILEKNESR